MSIYGNPVMLGGGGDGGSINILHGDAVPNASTGINGEIYLKTGGAGAGALLHFDTDVTTDAMGNTWTTIGSPTLSDAQSKFGGKSLYLNGSSYLQSDTSSEVFNFGTKNFTISCWVYPTSTARAAVFAMSADCRISTDIFFGQGSANLWLSSNGSSWNVLQSDDSGTNTGQGTIALSANTWTHLAYVRNGTIVRMYVNGQVAREATVASDVGVYWSGSDKFRIGAWGNAGYKFTGYIDEFIVANDSALWTDTFTPPTEPFSGIPSENISATYAKVNDTWQNLIGTDIDDINLGTNILSGDSNPSSFAGHNGSIFLQYYTLEDSGEGWFAKPGYICASADEDIGTINGRHYYKTDSNPAIVIFCNRGGYVQPHLASTIASACSYRADVGGPWNYDYTYTINGTVWYFFSGSYGFSNPTPVTDYPVVTNETFDFDTQANAERFLEIAGVSTVQQTPVGSSYAKVSGAWQDLIGTSINDIDLGSGGSGDGVIGFELVTADALGSTRTNQAFLNNTYLVAYFDDNMSQTFSVNGVNKTFDVISTGAQETLGSTLAVTNPPSANINAVLVKQGSIFQATHLDQGSYISVVGGWTGYPAEGHIFQSGGSGTTHSLQLDATYRTLLVFIGACGGSLTTENSITVNGVTYMITNFGSHYGECSMYGAIEINNNQANVVDVTFPVSCYHYVSVIGL